MARILYSVSSWKCDNFMFREYDRTYMIDWLHMNPNAYQDMKGLYDSLVEEAKVFNKGLLHMEVVMRKEVYEDWKSSFPTNSEILFDTRNI